MFLRAVNAEGEIKSKEYIAEKLISVIEEVGSRNVVQVITDNASNCKGAGLIVQQKYDHIFWTPCVVHTLNLALKSICSPKTPRTEDEVIFQECHWISEVAGDANHIKNYVTNHGMRLSMFKEFSKLKLLAIADTRFASVVVQLKRFCMVKRALEQMVISEKWESYGDGPERGTAEFVREKVLSAVWWRKVKYIVDFTEPIYEVLRVADTDTPCLHLIYEMWDSMIEKVKKKLYISMKIRKKAKSPLSTMLFRAYWLTVGLKATLHFTSWHNHSIQGITVSSGSMEVLVMFVHTKMLRYHK